MRTSRFRLRLFGAFMYVVYEDKIVILFLEGRQSGLASDGKHFIPSHVPAIEVRTRAIDEDASDEVTGRIDFRRKGWRRRSLWFLDRDEVTLAPAPKSNPNPFSAEHNTKPDDPPNEETEPYFGWVVPMPDAAGQAVKLDPRALYKTSPVGISARLELNFGACANEECAEDGDGEYYYFSFQPLDGSTTREYGGLSNSVVIDLGKLTGLAITRMNFLGTMGGETLVLGARKKRETVTLWNSPISHILDDGMMPMKEELVTHFELMYKVVTPPIPYPPVPHIDDFPGPNNANVTCPPAQIMPS